MSYFFPPDIGVSVMGLIAIWALVFVLIKYGFKIARPNPWTLAGILVVGGILGGLIGNFPFYGAGAIVYVVMVSIALRGKFKLKYWQIAICWALMAVVTGGEAFLERSSTTTVPEERATVDEWADLAADDGSFSASFPVSEMTPKVGKQTLGNLGDSFGSYSQTVYSTVAPGLVKYYITVQEFTKRDFFDDKTGVRVPDFDPSLWLSQRLAHMFAWENKSLSTENIIVAGKPAIKYSVRVEKTRGHDGGLYDGALFYEGNRLYILEVDRSLGDTRVEPQLEKFLDSFRLTPRNEVQAVVLGSSASFDADNDGLADGEEPQLATDPHRTDSDGDGLADGDEVHVFFTDPLTKFSAGSQFGDGENLRNGFNPLIPKKRLGPEEYQAFKERVARHGLHPPSIETLHANPEFR